MAQIIRDLSAAVGYCFRLLILQRQFRQIDYVFAHFEVCQYFQVCRVAYENAIARFHRDSYRERAGFGVECTEIYAGLEQHKNVALKLLLRVEQFGKCGKRQRARSVLKHDDIDCCARQDGLQRLAATSPLQHPLLPTDIQGRRFREGRKYRRGRGDRQQIQKHASSACTGTRLWFAQHPRET
jgi:hypothetical protein